MPEQNNVNKKFYLRNLFSTLFILILLPVSIYSSQEPNNFDILDSLIKSQAEKIISEIDSKGIKKIYIDIQNHHALWLVKQGMIESLHKHNIEIYDKAIENGITLHINIKKAELVFENNENSNDSLNRFVKVELSGNIVYDDGKTELISNEISIYNDNIHRDNIDLIKSEYDFANSPIPEKPKTFFEEVAEPIIIVTTAIITVVLLFTIRSS